jgi:hypothetical protein
VDVHVVDVHAGAGRHDHASASGKSVIWLLRWLGPRRILRVVRTALVGAAALGASLGLGGTLVVLGVRSLARRSKLRPNQDDLWQPITDR